MHPESHGHVDDPMVRRILECVRLLLPIQDLDQLLKAGVELARSRLGVERCALWLLNQDGRTFRGTWGTDIRGETTDEHGNVCELSDLEQSIPLPFHELEGWLLRNEPRRITWTPRGDRSEGRGWNTVTPLPGPEGNVGAFFQDSAITDAPLNPHQQDLTSLYCSLLGQLAGRRLAEDRERSLSHGLEEVLAAADELLAYDDPDMLHRRIVELCRERLHIPRAGLFVPTDDPMVFQGTWGTDWDGNTTDEHMGRFDFRERTEALAKPGVTTVAGRRWTSVEPFRMSWYDADGRRVDHAEGWIATHMLSVQDRVLGALFVDPGRSMDPLDPRKMELVATFCVLAARILDRRQTQDALQRANQERLESLGVLAGGIAHDFNNLLAAILGNVELLLEVPDLDRQRATRRLEDARQACIRGKTLAGQLLTFSRGGAPVSRPLPTLEFLEEAIRSSSLRLGVKWSVTLPDGDPWTLLADESQLGQVVQNLVVNACQWQEGEPVLDLTLRNLRIGEREVHSLKAGAYVQIDFLDHGPGIPEAVRSRVFDPYFTTRQGGSGLGLATCRSIVARHGGSIECLPSRSGALFRLRIPATDAPIVLPGRKSAEPKRRIAKRILVMDDETSLREMMRDILESHGAEVDTFPEGRSAWDAWAEARLGDRPFHLAILDLTVGNGWGGTEVSRRILEQDPGARILVCSGYSNDPVLAACQAMGFSGMLPKPFRMNELIEAVENATAVF